MESELKSKKPPKTIERVVIAETLKDKLTQLTTNANDILKGIATVTKGDIVNLLLVEHSSALSAKEIDALKAVHVTQTRIALWLARELKEKREPGNEVSLRELYARAEAMLPKSPEAKIRRPKRLVNGNHLTVECDEDNLASDGKDNARPAHENENR